MPRLLIGHGNRYLARFGFPPRKYSFRISCGSIDARSGGRHHRFDNGVFHAVLYHFHHELAVLSELAFSFILNLEIILKSFAFALIMGVVGGFLPAARAARLNIVGLFAGSVITGMNVRLRHFIFYIPYPTIKINS